MLKLLLTYIAFVVLSISTLAQNQQRITYINEDGIRVSGILFIDSTTIGQKKLIDHQSIIVDSGLSNESYRSWSKGYYVHFTSSLLVGKSEAGKAHNKSYHLSNGYQFGNGISLGVGTGIETLEVSLIPIYAELNVHPKNLRISPYFYLKSGYAVALKEFADTDYYYYPQEFDPEGGFLLNVGLGIVMYSWEKVALTIGAGYRNQKISITRYPNYWIGPFSTEVITHYNRVELKIGLLFR